jgi:hypothetical protein
MPNRPSLRAAFILHAARQWRIGAHAGAAARVNAQTRSVLNAGALSPPFPSALQLMDHEVLEEARGRQVAVPLDSDGREQLLDDVLAELRHMYGNVNTLFIHADKQVAVCDLKPHLPDVTKILMIG